MRDPYTSVIPYRRPDARRANRTDYAITHNLTPFVSMQNHYSLLYREEEREMFPTLKVSTSTRSQGHSQPLIVNTSYLALAPSRGLPWVVACSPIPSARRHCGARRTSKLPPLPEVKFIMTYLHPDVGISRATTYRSSPSLLGGA